MVAMEIASVTAALPISGLLYSDAPRSAPRRPPPPRSRGSSRSRTASPNMFRQYTTIVRHNPGHSASRGARSGGLMLAIRPGRGRLCAWPLMRVAVGGGAPNVVLEVDHTKDAGWK